jgi:hypothetical protein
VSPAEAFYTVEEESMDREPQLKLLSVEEESMDREPSRSFCLSKATEGSSQLARSTTP